MVSYDTLHLNLNPIGKLRTCTKISTRSFFINRHSCHKYIYILIVIIITVLESFFRCTISTFVETDLIFSFLVHFRWLQTFRNQMIHISESKTFVRCTFILFFSLINSRTTFLLLLSYSSICFCRIVSTSTNSEFFWPRFDLSLYLP